VVGTVQTYFVEADHDECSSDISEDITIGAFSVNITLSPQLVSSFIKENHILGRMYRCGPKQQANCFVNFFQYKAWSKNVKTGI